jgi:hypothetical protein
MRQDNWYVEIPAGEPLEQGDIIEGCSLLIPSEEHYEAILTNEETDSPIDIEMIDAITLSQSCDIAHNKIDSIILCPIISLKSISVFKDSREREILRRGNSPAYHLLNKFGTKTLAEDYYVVSFHHIYSVPKKFIETLVKNQVRKRLLPPYREHLSQSFARYFMRVGLPSDISPKEIEEYK